MFFQLNFFLMLIPFVSRGGDAHERVWKFQHGKNSVENMSYLLQIDFWKLKIFVKSFVEFLKLNFS